MSCYIFTWLCVCVCVCVGAGIRFWVAVPGGLGVNGCLGGVVDIKPDSTGNGALAEMANVCTNVKCPFSCSWGRDRRPQKGLRVPVSTAAWLRLKGLETSPYNPSREINV